MLLGVVILCLLGGVRTQDLGRETCSAADNPVILHSDAQAVLTGLVGFSSPGSDGYGCGPPQTGNMQAFEAVRWALQRINQDSGTINGERVTDSYIPGVKIGMSVHDTCSQPDVAIRGVLSSYPEVYAHPSQCTRNNTQILLGVLGPSYSATSQTVAELLSGFGVGQISYAATASSLSDQSKFPYFMRTIPPDSKQIQVILELLKELQWEYIAVVYTDDTYGSEGYQGLLEGASNAGLCITASVSVASDETSPDAFRAVFERILQTSAVGVVYFGVSAVAQGLLSTGASVSDAGRLQWIFSDSLGTDVEALRRLTYARGVITVAPATRHIAEFEDHWVRLEETNPPADNPWFQDWYMTTNNCRLPGVTRAPYNAYQSCQLLSETQKRVAYTQNQYVEPAIVAVYTFARALRDARDAVCGRGTRGLCAGLFSQNSNDFFQRNLKTSDFTFTKNERVPTLASNQVQPYNTAKRVRFDSNGDIVNPGYDIWNFNDRNGVFKFENVGTYLEGRLRLNRIQFYDESRTRAVSVQPTSPCPNSGCAQCMSGSTGGTMHAFIPGDVLFGGIFSAHKAGPSALSCGDLMYTGGVDLVEAFIYATGRLRNSGILRDYQVGSLILDDCSSPTKAQSMLGNFYSGAVDSKADPSQVFGFTAGTNDDVTAAVAEVLMDLGVAQVGYGSGLDSLKGDPDFRSVSPGYDAQAKTIVLTAKRFGWDYLQVVTMDDDSSVDFVSSLREAGVSEGICVGAVHSLPASSTPDYSQLITNFQTTPSAKVLVVHANPSVTKSILSALDSSKHDNVVLGTGAWGNDLGFITSTMRSNTAGILAIQGAEENVDAFSNYLNSLNPETYVANPWFRAWYEKSYDCYVGDDNPRGYATQCTNVRTRAITDGPNFKLSPMAGQVLRSVTALGRGLEETIRQFCGPAATSLCSQFRNAQNRSEILRRNIRDAAQNLPMRVEIKQVNRLGLAEMVGQYQVERDSFSLSKVEDFNQVMSSCNGKCESCSYMYPQQSSMFIPGDLLLGGVFNIHKSGDSPFKCGDVRVADGFQYSEAMAFALEQVNSGSAPVKLNGVKLGGFALDSCSSALRASNLVSSVHSGALTFMAGNNSLDVSRIQGWLSYTSSQSVKVASILGALDLAHLSPSATSTELRDQTLYPTFYRTVPADDRQTAAMAKLIQHMGWRFVQVVYSGSAYGRSAEEAFEDSVVNMDVCVLASYELGKDGTASEVMAKLLASPTTIVVIFADLADLGDLLKAKQDLGSSASDMVLVASETWGNSLSVVTGVESAADLALTFTVNTPPVQAFTQHMTSRLPFQYQQNPWFLDYYQALMQCDLGNNAQYARMCINPDGTPVTNSQDFSLDPRVLTTINAVYALTQALDLTLKEKCGGAYSGVCAAFLQDSDTGESVVAQLERATFTDITGETFRFREREGDVGYIINRYDQGSGYTQVGTYSGDDLKVTDSRLVASYGNIGTDCGDLCLRCQYNTNAQELFTYTPSDQEPNIIIAGLFDVHKRSSNPFSCGDINMNAGFQLLEAFNYAINYVNEGNGIFAGKLQGITIGGLGLDTCQSATRAANLIVNVHAGTVPLRAGTSTVRPELIDVYVGAYYSDMSRRVSEVLDVLSIPQVSYGSTSTIFQDKKLYKNFMRTVPADDRQADAMVALLRRYGISYVQVVNSDGTYGEQAADVFNKKASKNDICVAQDPITIGPGLTADQAVDVLLRRPLATVVILFIDTPEEINQFLQAVQRNPNARSLRFVGSETWAQNSEAIQGVEDVARSAVSLGVETADLPEFDEHLKAFKPGTSANPWFDEFYQEVFECSLAPGTSTYRTPCPDPVKEVVRSPMYQQDAYVLYTVNAVFSAALGIHHALQKNCGNSYYGMCTSIPRSDILEGIKQATFTDATRQIFEFNSKAESNRGYHIYTVKPSRTGNNYFYDNVGSYNDTHGLKIDARFNMDWDSNCGQQKTCEECPWVGKTDIPRVMQNESTQSLNLVGFFPIHYANPDDPLRCGDLNLNYGFQNVLAFFYAMDQVNQNVGITLPRSLKLGGAAIDTCSNNMRVSQDIFSLLRGEGLCGTTDTIDLLNPSTAVAYLTLDDGATESAASFLSLRGVTTLTPSATTPSLSEHDFLLRTLPPVSLYTKILVYLQRQFNWPYVLAVVSQNQYDKKAYDSFSEFTRVTTSTRSICVGSQLTLKMGATVSDAERLVDQLATKYGARTVVLFTRPHDTRLLLQAAQNKGLQDKFIWVGDLSSPGLLDGLEDVARGAISLQAYHEMIPGFYKYLETLTLDSHGAIPDEWFEEFWQHVFQCRKEDSPVVQNQYGRQCDKNDRINPKLLKQDPFVFHTITSVYMVAKGLNDIDECKSTTAGSSVEIAGCLARLEDKHRKIYENIKEAEIRVPPSDENSTIFFRFNDDGYGELGYTIYNFQMTKQNPAQYDFVQIGTWDDDNDLRVNLSSYVFYNNDGTPTSTRPISRCPASSTCSCVNTGNTGGTATKPDGSDGGPTYGSVSMDENFSITWGIIVAALTGLGILVTIFLFIYLLIFYPVKGGTTVLGYMLLFGILCIYVLNFAFILYPNEPVCAIRRFCLGLVYAICFSAMLVKVLNTWRLGSYFAEYAASYERLAHPCSLFFIALSLTLVQIIIGVEWLILRPPGSEDIVYEGKLIPRCSPSVFHNEELIMSCIFVMVLILLTLIFAAVTWDSEENNQESRWILITACFTIAIWIVWTIISTLTEIRYRDPAIAIANLVNATVILLCIYVRKIYLLNKYQTELEEEKRSAYSYQDDPKVFTNQAYDGTLNTTINSRKGSHAGSGVMYVYDGARGERDM